MIYEVYIDVYLIENMLLDAQILLLVLLLLKEKIVLWRLIAAALAGGIGAVLILLSGIGFGVRYVFMILALDIAMLALCMKGIFGREAVIRQLVMGVIYFHGIAFAHGKLMECADRVGGGKTARTLVSATMAAAVVFMLIYHRIMEERCIYEVVLTENGENIELKALLDTGNLLTDPVSGKPVSVVEETDTLRQWMIKYPQKYKVIPYHSIGNEHGILEGIVLDELMIQKKKEKKVEKDTIIALYAGKLSKDGTFQMILNHDLS